MKKTPENKAAVALTAGEKKGLRERLLQEQARFQRELAEIEERVSNIEEVEAGAEPSGYEDHPADLASETFEREKDLAMAESVGAALQKVRTALEKLKGSTYGVCDACGKPIAKKRLEALPYATLCVDCQARIELA
jgi:RNA polymerase-binding protein DksA